MKPEIMIFRSSAPKYQPFEHQASQSPVRNNNPLGLPTMSPTDMMAMLQNELDGLCQDSIENNYIQNGIRKAHYFLVAFDHTRREICGLLLLHMYQTWSPRFKQHTFGYIDLVCSRCKSFGKRLILSAETVCRNVGALFVRLNAVPDKVGYYESLGYEHKTQPCDRTAVPRPWTFARNRRATLNVDNIGIKMAKCL